MFKIFWVNYMSIKVAVIGVGPRGASLLERLITYIIDSRITNNIEILLFNENNFFGSGCHNPDNMSENLIINTVASQVTMYFGNHMKKFGITNPGPTLYEWFYDNKSKNISPMDYVSRKDLGEYLFAFYKKQVNRMNKHSILFKEIKDEVFDISYEQDCIEIKAHNKKYLSDYCVLCHGHQKQENNKDYIDHILNTNNIKNLNYNSMAIQGMGLTSFDVISELTEGLGGEFEESDKNILKYIPSGKEPKLYLFSRTGLFLSGRSKNKNPDFIYKPVFLTYDAIDSIKSQKEKIDFELDIIPLLKKELSYAYTAKSGDKLDVDAFFSFEDRVNSKSAKDFVNSFVDYLKSDITECLSGKFSSPYKFCQDVIRDIRDILRYAVNYDGLTKTSYKIFIEKWQPIFNRACVGPPYVRLQQLHALIDTGICSVKYAKNPIVTKNSNGSYNIKCSYDNETISKDVEFLVKARMPSLDYRNNENALIKNLSKKYKLFSQDGYFGGSIKINRDFNIHNTNGEICNRFYALGIPTEGSRYFTLVLGRPNMISTFLYESNNVAITIINKIKNASK